MVPQNKTTIGVRLRELLLKHPEGLTIDYISKVTRHPYECVAPVLQRTYGCYISHWIDHPKHYHLQIAVWKCIPVPENAKAKIKQPKPKPTPPEKPVYKPQKTVWVPVKPWGQA